MNLYVLPINPEGKNGYSIAVSHDLMKICPSGDDIVIWYESTPYSKYSNDIFLKRPGKYALSRVLNVLRNYVNCEVNSNDIKKLNLSCPKNIFCGDVIFYRALKQLYPSSTITVRFHNCFARIRDRLELLEINTNLKFKIQLSAYYKLEKEIFNDTDVYKLFISNEDRDYYVSNFGRFDDSEVWGFKPDMEKAASNRVAGKKKKFVHFGGLQIHKIDSLNWFINDVYTPLVKQIPNLEFHLWGKNSEILNNPSIKVFGHGFYNGDDLPCKEDGLFVNPDLTGGGVKIKLLDYFEKGASFISTPFGYEGYSRELIDNEFYYVIDSQKWLEFLTNYFSDLK